MVMMPAIVRSPLMSAPHRLLFLTGVVQFMAMMAWWSAALLDLSGAGPGLPGTVPPSLLHAPIMLFMVLPPFFLGFVLTVAPRWCGFPDTAPGIFRPVAAALVAATALLWAGLAEILPFGVLAGFTLSGIAWLWSAIYLASLLIRERRAGRAPTWHGWSILAALVAGLVCLAAAVAGIVQRDGLLIHSANLGGLILFVLPVFVTVCHRMIPFFAGNVVQDYVRWRPFRVLGGYWLASLLAVAGYVAGQFPLAAAGNLILALLTGLMLLKWLPRSAAPGLLWVLIAGFAWAPVGFALLALSDLLAPNLARGALHVLTVGLAGSLVVAMVTRVTQGHSGRPLTMTATGWAAFIAIQAASILRLMANFAGENLALLVVSALCLFAGLLPWGLRSAWIYLTPRVDGKPG